MPRTSPWTPSFDYHPPNIRPDAGVANYLAPAAMNDGNSAWVVGTQQVATAGLDYPAFLTAVAYEAAASSASGSNSGEHELLLYAGSSGNERLIAAWKTCQTTASTLSGTSSIHAGDTPQRLPFPIFIPAGVRLTTAIASSGGANHNVAAYAMFETLPLAAVNDVWPTHVVSPWLSGVQSYQPLNHLASPGTPITAAIPFDAYITSIGLNTRSSGAGVRAGTVSAGASGVERVLFTSAYLAKDMGGGSTQYMAESILPTPPIFVEAGTRLTTSFSGSPDLNVVPASQVIPIGAL